MSIGSLPYQLPTNVGWTFLQSQHQSITATASIDTAEADFGQVPIGYRWWIRRIAVKATVKVPTGAGISPANQQVCVAACLFTAYRNIIDPSAIEAQSSHGEGDVADFTAPLQLREGDTLLCVWSQGPQGMTCTASIDVDVYQKTS